MSRVRALSILAVTALMLAATTAPAGDTPYRRIRLDLGFHYSVGDYDTSQTTEIFYVPLTVRADLGRFTLRTTIPYLKIQGGTGVVEGPSGPVTSTGTGDGLGDVVVRGSYWLLSPLLPWMPYVDLDGIVKFPTADRDDGLGTGRFDFGVETEWTWAVRRFFPFVTLGYRFLGDRPSLRLHDVFAGSVGGQYAFSDRISAGALLEYREKASAASGERVEIVPFASLRLRPHWVVDTYVSAGLAVGSPDAGVGLDVGYVF